MRARVYAKRNNERYRRLGSSNQSKFHRAVNKINSAGSVFSALKHKLSLPNLILMQMPTDSLCWNASVRYTVMANLYEPYNNNININNVRVVEVYFMISEEEKKNNLKYIFASAISCFFANNVYIYKTCCFPTVVFALYRPFISI